MVQASQNIMQQFKDGGVVPADLVGQSAVSKKYVDDQLAERDESIASASGAANAAKSKIDAHVSSNTAHAAQSITYLGTAAGNNVKQAIDSTYTRISEIIANAGNDNTEIVDARGGFPVLGDRLNKFDSQFDAISLFVYPSQTTAEIQAVLNTGRNIAFTTGTYTLGQITIPSTVKSVTGLGDVKFVPDGTVPKDAPSSWITALSLVDAEIKCISLEADSAVYPELRCLDLTLCSNVLVERVRGTKGGGIAIYGAQCNYVTVRKCKIDTFAIKGISFDGAQQSNITIEDNIVIGTGLAHCISAQLGTQLKITRNFCKNATTFGIGLYQVTECIISTNTTLDTGKEGINIEDSSTVTIADNIVKWTTGTGSPHGTDFGISVYGSAIATQFNTIVDNTVLNPFAAGIVLADNVSFNLVADNQVLNANQGNVANHAGILLYGSNCLKNKVTGNMVTDTSSTHHKWGIAEYDFGTGAPQLNEITDNNIEGFITSDIKTTNTTTTTAMNNKDLSGFRTYSPVIGATAGTITTATASGNYMKMGKIVFFYVTATITTNGTGSGALTFSLPFNPARGSGTGKEVSTSGKALTVEIGSTINAQVRSYDNAYPATNGSIIQVSGMYEIA